MNTGQEHLEPGLQGSIPRPPSRLASAVEGLRSLGFTAFTAPALLSAALVLELAAQRRISLLIGATALQAIAAGLLIAEQWRRRFGAKAATRRIRRVAIHVASGLTLVLFLGARVEVLWDWYSGAIGAQAACRVLGSYAAVLFAAATVALGMQRPAGAALVTGLHLKPLQTVVASFGLAILAGTLLLSLPFSLARTESISLMDALFTSTSAVCVTGLSVVEVATHYTFFGQAVILVLIQAGGLGMMSLYAAFAALATSRLSARREMELGSALGTETWGDLRRSLKFILVATFTIEALGAALLYPSMRAAMPGNALWQSVFHSISAFCNAGFAIFPHGLGVHRDSPAVLGTLSLLIVLGGLGYPVLAALVPRWSGRARRGLHMKLTLAATGALLVLGFAGFLILEANATLGELDIGPRALNAFFHSVTSRTAGFDSVDLSRVSAGGAVFVMGLMVIGASPASTGGGLKTTTFAVLALTLYAVLRRQNEVRVFRRTVPAEDVLRACALVVAGISMLIVGLIILLAVEDLPPLAIAFEAVSAFSTTGLSLGITSELGPVSRAVVIVMMFIGRLGPLTLLTAFLERREAGHFRYPREQVLFG